MHRFQSLSERFVHEFCQASFLSLWTYQNPDRAKGKELCDTLIVCDPDIILFSVKEIALNATLPTIEDHKRWYSKAIEDSAKQLYGAERALSSLSTLLTSDGKPLELPASERRRIHRVAIALGSQGKTIIRFGDFGKGFIHVFDELSFRVALSELDTITDFVNYLTAKENFVRAGGQFDFKGGEEDLIAYYIANDRVFPSGSPLFVINNDLWDYIQRDEDYLAWKVANASSYGWDKLIESVTEDFLNDRLLKVEMAGNTEPALRCMARETRFLRKVLSKLFMEFYENDELRSRTVPSTSGVLYVFLTVDRNVPRVKRRAELISRCFLARGMNQEFKTVVGIATELSQPEVYSLDLSYMYVPIWSAEDTVVMQEIQKESGIYVSPTSRRVNASDFD